MERRCGGARHKELRAEKRESDKKKRDEKETPNRNFKIVDIVFTLMVCVLVFI